MNHPTKAPKKRRWHWHLMAVVGVWSVVFVANEAHRIHVQNQVLSEVPPGWVILEPRFPALNDDRWPSLFPRLATSLGGEFWNHDLVAVNVHFPSEELLIDLSKLQRLSNLKLRCLTLTERQIQTICQMEQLQWLLLRWEDRQEPAVDRFRAALPRTYVTQ